MSNGNSGIAAAHPERNQNSSLTDDQSSRDAIPTSYAGVVFRSRLEARWAALFDRLAWPWSYEPVDLDGWIPDFALSARDDAGRPTRPVLVEVKPIEAFDEIAARKIDRADRQHEVLLTGYTLPIWNGRVTAGWLRDENMEWAPAPLGRWTGSHGEAKNEAGVVGFCHGLGGMLDRITGCDDGPCYGAGKLGPLALERMWRDAGNRVQWRGPDAGGPVRVVVPVDPEAEVGAFVSRGRDWRHLADDEVDRLVEQECDPAVRKELIATLLSSNQITFGQARRQVRIRPELEGA